MAKKTKKKIRPNLDGIPVSKIVSEAVRLWKHGKKKKAKQLFYIAAATEYHFRHQG